jgi:type II secretory ATPase GspE/PulE/Tfp pilus assembly ATPase PilB-like protein
MKSWNKETFSPRLLRAFEVGGAQGGDATEADTTGSLVRALLLDAVEARASDVHFDPLLDNIRVGFRIDGTLFEAATLPLEAGLRLMRYCKVQANLDPAPMRLPEDSHFRVVLEGKPLDIRLAGAPCVYGDKLALRLLRRAPVRLRLKELGLREEDRGSIERWLGDMSGMFLVAGPVGSGKTTTLYSLLSELHLTQRSIVTIEDPVEYQLDRINQIEVDAGRGLTFERGLRSILRLDADYILLGEIRDRESARIAMEASSTGRVVLTTMHSRNAAGVITALRSLGIPNYELAASLAFIVAQRLVRKLCLHCRREEPPTESERRWLASLRESIPETVWHAAGCEKCSQTGYFDRTGLFEVLPVDEHVYDLVLAGKDEHGLRAHLRGSGFRPLLTDGLAKAAQGVTDYAELTRIGAQSYLDRAMPLPEEHGASSGKL